MTRADVFVAAVALLLGLMFIAAAFVQSTRFNRLALVRRIESRWGRAAARVFHILLGLTLLAASAAILLVRGRGVIGG